MFPKVRYEKLGYVELNVSDLGKSGDFYQEIVGLELVGPGPGGGVRFRCSDDLYTLVLHQGSSPGHKRTGVMLEDNNQFENLFRRLTAAGIPYEELVESERKERGFSRAARIVDPVLGAVMEFYLPADAKKYEFQPSVASIQRLGHVVWGTPKVQEATAHFRDVLNFAPSDYIEGVASFFHLWPNPWHHGIGVGIAPKTVYNHTNFMVTEIDDIGRATHRLNRAGIPIVYGPGRHLASGSAFLYFLDPDGLTCEYSFDMEQFPEVDAREPRVLQPKPEVLDSWLSPRDPRCGAFGEVETYQIKSPANA